MRATNAPLQQMSASQLCRVTELKSCGLACRFVGAEATGSSQYEAPSDLDSEAGDQIPAHRLSSAGNSGLLEQQGHSLEEPLSPEAKLLPEVTRDPVVYSPLSAGLAGLTGHCLRPEHEEAEEGGGSGTGSGKVQPVDADAQPGGQAQTGLGSTGSGVEAAGDAKGSQGRKEGSKPPASQRQSVLGRLASTFLRRPGSPSRHRQRGHQQQQQQDDAEPAAAPGSSAVAEPVRGAPPLLSEEISFADTLQDAARQHSESSALGEQRAKVQELQRRYTPPSESLADVYPEHGPLETR